MTSGRRIEYHVVKLLRSVWVTQKQGKLVKGCNFDGTGPRQPFFEQLQLLRRQYTSIWPDRPFAIFARCLFGVDVHGLKVRAPRQLASDYLQAWCQERRQGSMPDRCSLRLRAGLCLPAERRLHTQAMSSRRRLYL